MCRRRRFVAILLVGTLITSFCAAPLHADLPATGRSPYPILLIHGIWSSAAMWSPPRGAEPGVLPHFGSFGWVTGGQFDANLETAQTLDQVLVHATSFEDATGDVWTINFDQTAGGFDRSNAEAIYKQGRAVRDAIKFIKELTHADRVILVGHSMGGLAALSYVFSDLDGDGRSDFYHNDVVRIVTIGAPVKGTCLEGLQRISHVLNLNTVPAAHRDLCKPVAGNPNPFLYGGQEIDVALPFFGDVNCNGQIDFGVRIRGLIESIQTSPSVPIAYIAGLLEDNPPALDVPPLDLCCPRCPGDGVVEEDAQFLRGSGEILRIDAAHTRVDRFPYEWHPDCEEIGALDAIVAALDESDRRDDACPLRPERPTAGFLTHQGDGGGDTDVDFWVLDPGVSSSVVIEAGHAPVAMEMVVTTEAGDVLADKFVNAGAVSHLDLDLTGLPGSRLFVEVSASVSLSNSGIGTAGTACDSRLSCCRNPYVLLASVDVKAPADVPPSVSSLGASLPSLATHPSLVLIVDSSGSMSESDPEGLRVAGASLLLDRLTAGTSVAMVDFDERADLVVPLSAGRDAVRTALEHVNAAGGTNITAALDAGYHVIESAVDPRAALLFTDGKSSERSGEEPFVQAAIPVHVVGLGSSVEADYLQDLAARTGGIYMQASRPEDLIGAFDIVVGEFSGEGLVFSIDGVIRPGETLSYSVPVDGSLRSMSLRLTWPGSSLSMQVKDPTGRLAGVDAGSGNTYRIVKVDNAVPGNWSVEVRADQVPNTGEPFQLRAGGPSDVRLIAGLANVGAQARFTIGFAAGRAPGQVLRAWSEITMAGGTPTPGPEPKPDTRGTWSFSVPVPALGSCTVTAGLEGRDSAGAPWARRIIRTVGAAGAATATPWHGEIVQVDGGIITMNRGARSGIRPGMTVRLEPGPNLAGTGRVSLVLEDECMIEIDRLFGGMLPRVGMAAEVDINEWSLDQRP